jgi:hypothetical protein
MSEVTTFKNIFTEDELLFLTTNEAVVTNLSLLKQSNEINIFFPLDLPESIKNKLIELFDLSYLKTNSQIYMRWSKGDVKEHIDVSNKDKIFDKTLLIYLTDSIGEFVVDNNYYDIKSNTGYIFDHNLIHKVTNTENNYRLMMGPINEFGNNVGPASITLNSISPNTGSQGTQVVLNITTNANLGTADISVSFSGVSTPVISVAAVGTDIYNLTCTAPAGSGSVNVRVFIIDGGKGITSNTIPFTYTSNSMVCFKENSMILTDQGYKLIQDLRKGDLVKTLLHNYLPIDLIGKKEIHHSASKERIKDQLYQCSQDHFEEIFEPLIITGCHSILVDDFISEEQREKVIEVNGNTYVTDGKYRLPACADPRASIYEIPGNYTIYHLALENDDYYMNYGIYANGLLVETCSKRYLKELSNMELI